MERIFVTICEPSLSLAIEKARALPAGTAVELRSDSLGSTLSDADLASFRGAVESPLLLTRRTPDGVRLPSDEPLRALRVGFEYVDVEFTPDGDGALPAGVADERALVSVHDFNGVPDLDRLVPSLRRFPQFKIAATPSTFAENLELLRHQQACGTRASIFGMGARGLYSRYLSPFLGGRPAFVASDERSAAAPGQLSLETALAVYGADPCETSTFFGVLGNPASHSRSPRIHNRIFRSRDVSAAYGVLEFDSCIEILESMLAGEDLAPQGLSITTPFKSAALEWGRSRSVTTSDEAERAGAVNTVVRVSDRMRFENTDVDGFRQLIQARKAATGQVVIVGAGATARAAAVALQDLGIPFSLMNRTSSRAEAFAATYDARLIQWANAADSTPSLVIDTLPPDSEWTVPDRWCQAGVVVIRADYSTPRGDEEQIGRGGGELVDGLTLLAAQAVSQARMFLSIAAPDRDFRDVTVAEVRT